MHETDYRALGTPILAAMLREPGWLASHRKAIRSDAFPEQLRLLAQTTIELFDATGEVPDLETLERRLEDFGVEEDTDTLASLWDLEFQPKTLSSMVVEWAKVTRMMDIAADIPDRLAAGDVDSVIDELRRVDNITPAKGARHTITASNLDEFLLQRGKTKQDRRFPTGWKTLDSVTNGGLPEGAVGVILAPASGGKTTALVNLGYNCIRRRQKVLHITLENTLESVIQRYIQRFIAAGMTKARAESRLFTMIKQQRLALSYRDYKSVDVNEVCEEIQTIAAEHGTPFDVVILDYATALSYSGRQERWDAVRTIYETLRATAAKLKCALWTGHHAKNQRPQRGFYDQEHAVDAKSISNIIDLGVSLNMENWSAQSMQSTMFIFKSRLGGLHTTIDMRTEWPRSIVKESLNTGGVASSILGTSVL